MARIEDRSKTALWINRAGRRASPKSWPGERCYLSFSRPEWRPTPAVVKLIIIRACVSFVFLCLLRVRGECVGL